MGIDTAATWSAFFLLEVLLTCVTILHRKDFRIFYFVAFGAMIGFVFDFPAIFLDFYSYNQGIDPVSINGIPLTISVAEGMSMSFIIVLFEAVSKKLKIKF